MNAVRVILVPCRVLKSEKKMSGKSFVSESGTSRGENEFEPHTQNKILVPLRVLLKISDDLGVALGHLCPGLNAGIVF